MIPILYESNETNFSHHGLGDLIDCTECTVTEERNGIYECEISYPIKGQHYSEISVDRIIKVKANEISNPQAFRIYRISKPINGIVKVYLQHISYDLNSNIVSPFSLTNVNATTALNEVLNKTCYDNHFTATSTLSTTSKLDIKVPVSARKCLGGMDGSILDNFGGEYEFDNFTIKLHANRGQDNGVRIAYGKNLTDITAETAIDSTYTSVYPYVVDSKGKTHTLSGDEKVIEIDTELNLGEPKTLALDLSEKFQNTKITDEKIRQYANAYIKSNKVAEISQNIEVSFVQLWQSKEYETLALLERIKLCDIVTIEYPALGVSAKAKVIKTEYDGLNEKYIKITLGKAKSNFSSTLNKISSDVKAMPSIIQSAVSHATELITGGLGGYVVISPNEETGYPEEILIMDDPDKNKAVNVWRFNKGGLGHSHTGYNGPFNDIALTYDGQINASMITAGELNADLIKSGTIQDKSGTTSINLSTGKITVGQSTSARRLDIYNTGVLLTDTENNKFIGGLWSYPPKIDMPYGQFDSVFVGDVDNGGVSLDNNHIGFYPQTQTETRIEPNSIKSESITVGTSTLSTNGNYLSSSKAYQAKGFSVAGSSGTEAGAFYLATGGSSVLKTNVLNVDGKQYSEKAITVDGQTVYVLAHS